MLIVLKVDKLQKIKYKNYAPLYIIIIIIISFIKRKTTE